MIDALRGKTWNKGGGLSEKQWKSRQVAKTCKNTTGEFSNRIILHDPKKQEMTLWRCGQWKRKQTKNKCLRDQQMFLTQSQWWNWSKCTKYFLRAGQIKFQLSVKWLHILETIESTTHKFGQRREIRNVSWKRNSEAKQGERKKKQTNRANTQDPWMLLPGCLRWDC